MLVYLLFLVPIMLAGGVALQAFAVYAIGILPAVFLLRKGTLNNNSAKFFISLAVFLSVVYFCFPIANLLGFFDIPKILPGIDPWPPPLVWSKIFSSRFSFSFFVSVLILGATALWLRLKPPSKNSTPFNISAGQLLWWFFFGLAVMSVLWLAYLLFQAFSGFDYRMVNNKISFRAKSGDIYRVYGLYGHPLSVGGVALTWFALAWQCFWLRFDKNFNLAYSYISEPKFLKSNKILSLLLLLTVFCQFIAVVLSGGRTPLVAAIILLVLCPMWVRLNTRMSIIRIGTVFISLASALVVVFFTGIKHRFMEAFQIWQNGTIIDDRVLFWKAHYQVFLDNWLFGRGHFWLDSGLRKYYYFQYGNERIAINKNFNAHNIYIEILSNVGVIGTLIIVAAVFFLVKSCLSYITDPVAKFFGIGLIASIVGNLIHGLTENTFFVSNIMLVYLSLFFILLWLSEIEKNNVKKSN